MLRSLMVITAVLSLATGALAQAQDGMRAGGQVGVRDGAPISGLRSGAPLSGVRGGAGGTAAGGAAAGGAPADPFGGQTGGFTPFTPNTPNTPNAPFNPFAPNVGVQ